MTPELRRAAALMRDFDAPWGVAGGWAIDLFLGVRSRPHADVDVAILRDHQRELRDRLRDARVAKVVNHRLTPWAADETLAPPVHEVHATWPDGFHLEFLLDDHDPVARDWIFRRDRRIRRSLDAAFTTTGAIPHLAPEVVLLYKSRDPSPKDDADFDASRPRLDPERRAWLADALAVTAPGHRWAPLLAPEPSSGSTPRRLAAGLAPSRPPHTTS
jgi:hypothetical protein